MAKTTMYKKHEVDEDVVTLARRRIKKTFDEFDHVAVSFSGGKDSTAILNLAYEEAKRRDELPLDVIFFDEEAIPYQTEDYVRRIANKEGINLRWYCIPTEQDNSCSSKYPVWYQWAPENEKLWVRPMPEEAILEMPYYDYSVYKDPNKRLPYQDLSGPLFIPYEDYGKVALIIGIRSQESLMRYMAVARRKKDNYIIKERSVTWGSGKIDGNFVVKINGVDTRIPRPRNVWKIYPIYDWRTEDVWKAPKEFGWDYNRAYDLMDKHGIRPHDQRVCPPYNKQAISALDMFKTCYPELWDKMHQRVPGAATAARWAGTSLYSYGGVVKPDDQSWQEFIKNTLENYNPKKRKGMAKIIRRHIQRHNKKTSEPILPETKHWFTGLSWKWLASITHRGDLKERETPHADMIPDKMKQRKDKYYKALEKYRGGGAN